MDLKKQTAFGPVRYLQGPGVMENVGEEALLYGNRALVIAGKTAWEKAGGTVEKSLRQNGIDFVLQGFGGYCSPGNIIAAVRKASEFHADVIIGVGGGKVMDTAKSTADTLNLKCVTAPTSAATCAGAVQLCVWYDDQGKMIPGITMKESVAAVIADTDIIVRNCPKRLLASGIADALAKYPELEYNVSIFPLPGITETFEVSKTVAYRNYRFLLEHAAQCLEEASLKKTTPLTEDLVACLIANTGLASSLVSGVRQLAVAHKFYSAVTILFKESRDAFYHGEIVSCGMIIQFYVNGYAEGQIENLSAFLKSLGTPVCLSDLGIEPTEKNCRLIFDYLMDNGFDAPGVRKRIEQGFEAIKR